MPALTALFWDIGGVLLTNGWDTTTRQRAADKFGLEWEEFQERHELVVSEFEKGELSLEEYLDCTVFYRGREFTPEMFRAFMFEQSQPQEEVLALAQRLAGSGRYLMATLNNESRELNHYRIEQFGLRRSFTSFFSSCFLGVKKPERGIYQTALQVSQCAPEECVFIDDRALNVEGARRLGLTALRFRDTEQLRRELAALGVEADEG